MKQDKPIQTLGYLLLIPALKLLYFVFNRLPRPATVITIAFDDMIPVVSLFVLPYLAFYPFVLGGLIFLFVRHRQVYLRTVWSYALGLCVCYATYILFQTTVPRPEMLPSGALADILRFIYSIDEPYNCLPSIHVLGTLLVMMGLSSSEDRPALWIRALGWLIILSTLFTKQHGVLDVFAAIALAIGSFALCGRFLAWKTPLTSHQDSLS